MSQKFTRMLFVVLLSLAGTMSYGASFMVGSDSCRINFSYYMQDSVVHFIDSSACPSGIVSYKWDFGDGSSSIQKNPMHIYAPGIRQANVCLTVKNQNNESSSACKVITVRGADSCYAGFTYYMQKDSMGSGFTYYFSDISSANVIDRTWNFGDSTYSSLKDPIHTYGVPGATYEVSLMVNTLFGCADTAKRTIVIPNITPQPDCYAAFSFVADYDTTGYGVNVRFVDYSSPNVTSRYWDFGDGTSSVIKDPEHRYTLPSGSYVNIREIVYTSLGCTDTISKKLHILNPFFKDSCYANFTYAQDSTVSSGWGYRFTNLSSGNATSFYWDFGDGTSSVLKDPAHVYRLQADSQVIVTLRINTNMLCADSAFKTIVLPSIPNNYILSGKVTVKNAVLSSGIIAMYKKNSMGRFILKDANVITDGSFKFDQLAAGKYIICAIPDINNSGKCLPTYYVSSLHWATANVIDLKSNAQGLTLKMIAIKSFGIGTGSINGNVMENTFDTYFAESNLKSTTQITYNVYLYSESGEVISSVTPDVSGNFSFQNLPYGKYSLNVEYPNLESRSMSVSLTQTTPAVNNIQFTVDHNALSVNPVKEENGVTVYYVSERQVAVRVREAGKYSVSVVSITGSILYQSNDVDFEANTDKIIDLKNIPSGTYLLKLQNNDGVLVKKLAK